MLKYLCMPWYGPRLPTLTTLSSCSSSLLSRYTEVPRTAGISTTELIDRIASRLAVDYREHALPSERRPVVAVVREITGLKAGAGS